MYAGVLDRYQLDLFVNGFISVSLCVFVNECLTVDAHYNILFIHGLTQNFFLY